MTGRFARTAPNEGDTGSTSLFDKLCDRKLTALEPKRMIRKIKGASALSLVATMAIMLFGAEGSRAQAEEGQIVLDTIATEANRAIELASGPVFVSEPVIQDVSEAQIASIETADSLADLVAMQDAPARLSEQMRCLAGAIYFESKGESLAGQLAVGRVVINRAESARFPDSYCGVVYQRAQFSFVRGGRMPSINTSSRAWQRAKKLAVIADQGLWDSDAEGALFFHADYVAPRWRLKMARLAQIDNHIFYR